MVALNRESNVRCPQAFPRMADSAWKWNEHDVNEEHKNEDDEYVVFDRIQYARPWLACIRYEHVSLQKSPLRSLHSSVFDWSWLRV